MEMRILVQLLVAISMMLHSAFGQNDRLSISISTDNRFNITVSGKQWFRSGPIKVRNKGAWLSSTDGSLILNGTYATTGEDVIGTYQFWQYQYHDKPAGEFQFETFLKVYDKVDVLTFGHKFISGAEKAATDSADGVISSFPSILVEDAQDSSLERGYVTFEGNSKCIHVFRHTSPSIIYGLGYFKALFTFYDHCHITSNAAIPISAMVILVQFEIVNLFCIVNDILPSLAWPNPVFFTGHLSLVV